MPDIHTIHIKNIRKDPSHFELAFGAPIAVRWAAMSVLQRIVVRNLGGVPRWPEFASKAHRRPSNAIRHEDHVS
jgi:hypothetical protein